MKLIEKTLIEETIFPQVPPLSGGMVRKLAQERGLPTSLTLETVRTDVEEQIQEQIAQMEIQWQPLVQEIQELRSDAEKLLSPYMKKLPAREFAEILYELTKKRVPKNPWETLSRWRDKGLMRFNNEDQIAIESAIALLIMRMADQKKRSIGWLPGGDHTGEPYMYVWRIDRPGSPAIPCGLPLADALPSHAFLYTRWDLLGNIYDEWVPFGRHGSVRWPRTIKSGEETFYSISQGDLSIWHQEISSLDLGQGIPDELAPGVDDMLAKLVLIRVARNIFRQPASPLPSVS